MDIDAHITRLEARLAYLRKQKEKQNQRAEKIDTLAHAIDKALPVVPLTPAGFSEYRAEQLAAHADSAIAALRPFASEPRVRVDKLAAVFDACGFAAIRSRIIASAIEQNADKVREALGVR